jgi:4-hydroxy-tetrahydrodipicolinate synthase
MRLTGNYPALITPFRNDEVDERALRALVDRTIEGGVNGLVPLGTTGESVTMSDAEHARVLAIVVDQAKDRVPVIAGVGTVSTRHTIHLAKQAREAGADGLLIVCPYYNRPTQAGLEAHFRAVLTEVPLPTVLYNIPIRTGVDLSVDTLERLGDIRAIVGIKEATNNVLRTEQILARCGDRFSILSGDDALTLPILAAGGTGVISVAANVLPKETSFVTRAFAEGKLEEARKMHLRLMPVYESLFIEASPGPVKAVLAEAGHIAPEIRLPLVWPTEATRGQLREVFARAGFSP